MPRGKKVNTEVLEVKVEDTNDLPLRPKRVPTNTQGKMNTLKAIAILQQKGYQILPPEPVQKDVEESLGIKKGVKREKRGRKMVLELKMAHTLGGRSFPAGKVELDAVKDSDTIHELLHQEQLAIAHEKELFGPQKFYFVVEATNRRGDRAVVGREVRRGVFEDETKAPVLATIGAQDVSEEGGGVVY